MTSAPAGAQVFVEPGGYRLVAPSEIALRRKDAPFRLTFTLDGYDPYTVLINTEMNGWLWGNLLLGALPGILVDFTTGASEVLTPETVHANLARSTASLGTDSENVVFIFAPQGQLLATVTLID